MEELKEREKQLKEDVSKRQNKKLNELTPLDKYIYARKKTSDNLFVFENIEKNYMMSKKLYFKAELEANSLEENKSRSY